MQTAYKRFSVITGFALLILLLIANASVIRRQLSVQVQNQGWVSHTQQVLLNINQIQQLMTDAETGQRGYLYTGNPEYLQPYQTAITQIQPNVDHLAWLTADNPVQQERIPELRTLTQEKLAELGRTIALYQAGQPDAARTLVFSNGGKHTMDQIRVLVGAMDDEERSLEVRRTAAYSRSVAKVYLCVYLASALAVFGLALLAYYVLRQIKLREKHAAEISEREAWFRVTLTSIGDGVIATDALGRVTFLNTLAEQLTGNIMADAVGKQVDEAFPIFNEYTLKPVENPVTKVMADGRIVGLANHTVLRHRNGKLTPIEDSAAPIRTDTGELAGVVLVFRDATYERKSQEVLRKTEKLAAAARLAATVSHEINNPLEAVGNLVYLTKNTPGLPPEAVANLALAEQELERVSHITRQTLGFYRETNAPTSVEMQAVLESVLKLYDNKLRTKNIRVTREFAACPRINALAGELRQMFSNLISNAADAAPQGGNIMVSLGSAGTGDACTIKVVIADDGPGVSADNVDMIFEPFFTTKEDVGTGLGLWIAREIAGRHNGGIGYRSGHEDGHGATFTVTLPVNADMQ